MKFSTIITHLCATAALLAVGMPAYSASISLVPSGTQLDSDPINDRPTQIGDTLSFTFRLDTSGLTANLRSLVFSVVRDPGELELLGADNTASQAVFPNFSIFEIDLSDPRAEIRGADQSGPIGVAPNTTIDLFTTTYNIGSLLDNNGVSDLKIIEVTSAVDANGTDVTSSFQVSPGVEIQSTPEPSTLLGLGVTFCLGALAKRKRK